MSYSSSKDSFLPPLWVLTVLAIISLGYVAMQLREILMLLVAGYCIAYVMEPALDWLENKGVSRSFGIVLIILFLTLAIIALIVSAIPTISREAIALGQNFPRYFELAIDRIGPYITFINDYLPADMSVESIKETLEPYLANIDGTVVRKIFQGIGDTLLKGYSITLTILNLTLLPFIVFYLAIDFKALHSKGLEMVPLLRRSQVQRIAEEIDHYVSAFVRGQISVASILFLLYAAGLGVVGVELWFLLAVISGFGNIIPYLGFALGIVLSTIMALVTFGDITHVLMVWGVFAAVQFLEGMVITPKIIGESVGLSPLTVILSIVAGGTLFGLVGIFLAIPMFAAVKVLAKHLHAWVLVRS